LKLSSWSSASYPPLEDASVRIDVVAVTFDPQGKAVVEHYQNAFDSPW
jgi:Holliday junction resolvase-like predicted endonuclease